MALPLIDPFNPPAPAVPDRPRLVVVHGGRASRVGGGAAPAEMIRRRRLIALTLVALVAAAGLRWSAPPADTGRAPLPAAGVEAAAAAPGVHVVGPGETLWSIARRLRPDGDIRPTVARLAAANGGTQLRVGQQLRLVSP